MSNKRIKDLVNEAIIPSDGVFVIDKLNYTEAKKISISDFMTYIDNNISQGVTDHGALSGLTDDDHPQYLKEAPIDGQTYGRNNSSWSVVTGGSGVSEFGGIYYGWKAAPTNAQPGAGYFSINAANPLDAVIMEINVESQTQDIGDMLEDMKYILISYAKV
jgi:hypothetical protein